MKFCLLKKGFTLIELLIVVAIIAILAAIAIPNFLEAQTRSKVSRAKSDMRTASIAIESFRIDHGLYPPDGFWLMNAWGQVVGAMPWVDNAFAPWFTPPTPQGAWDQIRAGLNLWRFDNNFFLTTPVAYMTSLPRDTFDDKTFWWYGTYIWLNFWDRWKWSLIDNPNAQPVMLDGRTFGTLPIDGKKTFHWCIGSCGPDQAFNDHVTPVALPSWLQYDPSNGTVSGGDIFRIGP